ncbi:leucyl/phenylalanyl-tRNA--protein transferase [Marinomonas sp. IMCC 4694]|uniref:leucyl/phenylalanyl-tRNA--protein transferase n=1 Tax=Marinomonas sp. IMCC 4694 TaxID=2605432 RepID=UPI0011E84FE7|nr:leucyl/phenylalanyl-tRNA--protein transferase [Marinomonas sp. IMCC 4694]TYL47388.1 leucyl/phenylalanyl-tRNA--protein transferase [Marinomonas sp. IMCC 4694]
MTPPNNAKQQELVWLTGSPYDTPDPDNALLDPEGLCAVGGDLSSTRLLHLYRNGFFPWYSDPDPILWWHPKERCTLLPEQFHCAKSLNKTVKNTPWTFSVNAAFERVIHHCAALRADKEGTWISKDIQAAYTQLHSMGFAHSIEIWREDELIGGFYGVAMGEVFFGESMFSLQPNASKVALKLFCDLAKDCGITLIDCQVESDHLLSLGARCVTREAFCTGLKQRISTIQKNVALIEIGQRQQKQPIFR